MNDFQSEYFILLTEAERDRLVSARNRDDFQPDLNAFLNATRNLKALRRLAFDADTHEWAGPRLFLQENDEILDHERNIRGRRYVLPLPARPGEAQMALSYDWFWSEFCKFIMKADCFPVFYERQIIVFSKENMKFDINQTWDNFIKMAGSKDFVSKYIGYYFNNKMIYKQKGPKAPTKAKAWHDDVIPIFSRGLRDFLITYYENISLAPVKYFSDEQCDSALKRLRELKEYEEINFPNIPISSGIVKPGDNSSSLCAGCGKPFDKKEKKFKRVSAFLKDGNERPQSATQKDEKSSHYCKLCVLQVTLCPLKFTNESLSVKFIGDKQRKTQSWSPLFEEELRKYTAQSLDVHAGNFLSIHLTESYVDDGKRKNLCQSIGAYHYALWKMSVTFPPELMPYGKCRLLFLRNSLLRISALKFIREKRHFLCPDGPCGSYLLWLHGTMYFSTTVMEIKTSDLILPNLCVCFPAKRYFSPFMS